MWWTLYSVSNDYKLGDPRWICHEHDTLPGEIAGIQHTWFFLKRGKPRHMKCYLCDKECEG